MEFYPTSPDTILRFIYKYDMVRVYKDWDCTCKVPRVTGMFIKYPSGNIEKGLCCLRCDGFYIKENKL